jgi:RimJ/RimL family protein N-acetyltransferase
MIPQPEFSITEVELNLKNFLELWENDDTYMFHVVDAATDKFIGNSLLNQVNRRYQMANLSYWVRTSHTGQGIATKAARLVARYGFEKLGLQRIEIVVSNDNTPSLRVAEKLGAIREGLLRNRMQILGSPCDAYMHSLIPKDYGINNNA